MKKSTLLKTAVAAAIALPMVAQADIYGRAQVGVEYSDNGTTDAWDIGSGGHARWGIVGSEDLGNGMKAVYQYEYDMAPSSSGDGSTVAGETTRVFMVGLQGDWGKLTIGRNWLPVFGRLAVPAAWVQAGRNVSRSYIEVIGSTRDGDLLTYDTPNMNGFSAGFAMAMSSTEPADDGVDRWAIGADYKAGGLAIGGAYEVDEAASIDRWGIAGNYSFDAFKLRAAYYSNDPDVGSGNDGWLIGGEGKFGNNTVYAFYEDWETTGGTVDNSQIRLLFHHHLSKETRLFAEFNHIERDTADDMDLFEVGILKFWKL